MNICMTFLAFTAIQKLEAPISGQFIPGPGNIQVETRWSFFTRYIQQELGNFRGRFLVLLSEGVT